MSDLMRPISFEHMVDWVFAEYNKKKSVFGIHESKFYHNKSGKNIEMFGQKLSSPIGPAAGPNSQLAQNILASYLAGARFMELKTVQIMDGEELRKCVPRPCINAEDECYNVEWSTELTVQEAFDEYVKGYFLIQLCLKEFDLAKEADFAFNMSVGYDLEGIQSPKIDAYIEGMKDASQTEIWKECVSVLQKKAAEFKNFKQEDIAKIPTRVCNSITLSTLHGCPPDEIERISRYLLTEKGVHTFIKCNPTLLGYETARRLLDEMGYDYISFDEHHFQNDLQYGDAVEMLKRLQALADEQKLSFGVKITNTFPVQIKANELPGEEMYMSGRSLYPLSLTVARRLSDDFGGKLAISFSGGMDAFNIVDLFMTGVQPITVATTVLKPGGYERMQQLAELLEPMLKGAFAGIDVKAIDKLADEVVKNPYHLKSARPYGSRKTDSQLPLYDCYKAPCKDGGCPIEQQIPEYLRLVNTKDYKGAFDIIAVDNTCPAILGTICAHPCQSKCTRMDYESSLQIRQAKGIASDHAQDDYINAIKASELKTDKKAVVIGAGPGGIAAALYLRRNGMQVKVLEKRDKPYGIVTYAIPEFRIADKTIERDYNMALKQGVEFEFGVDENYDIAALKKAYDYVIVATGTWEKCNSPVKEGADKVLDCIEFLLDAKKGSAMQLGKRVAVVGAGDVAMDCARVAKHNEGVEEVTIVYRRSRRQMPGSPEEIEDAIKDGVEMKLLLAPVSYDGKTLHCEKTKLGDVDASGRRGIVGIGEYEDLQFDSVIAATGAKVNPKHFEGLETNKWGYPVLNEANESSVSGVYVAGDCKSGPSTIVNAVADGKAIAKDILHKLSLDNDFVRCEVPQDEKQLMDKKGLLMHVTNNESDCMRCLACDQVCELCCDVCPNRANVRINIENGPFALKEQIVHIDGMCNECGNCGVFCPHTGNPYKDKVTVFWTEEDFEESTNKGFLPLGGDQYKVRGEEGNVFEYRIGEQGISAEMQAILESLRKDYAFYLSR